MLMAIGAATLAITVMSLIYLRFAGAATGRVDAPKILAAARAYAQSLTADGTPIPASVNLRDLVARGRLLPGDISGFAGMEVTATLAIAPNRPQEVLMRARLPNGDEMVALADGSVHQARP